VPAIDVLMLPSMMFTHLKAWWRAALRPTAGVGDAAEAFEPIGDDGGALGDDLLGDALHLKRAMRRSLRLPIHRAFAQLSFAVDHGGSEVVAARARRYAGGKRGVSRLPT
jgi:hypothetical protein